MLQTVNVQFALDHLSRSSIKSDILVLYQLRHHAVIHKGTICLGSPFTIGHKKWHLGLLVSIKLRYHAAICKRTVSLGSPFTFRAQCRWHDVTCALPFDDDTTSCVILELRACPVIFTKAHSQMACFSQWSFTSEARRRQHELSVMTAFYWSRSVCHADSNPHFLVRTYPVKNFAPPQPVPPTAINTEINQFLQLSGNLSSNNTNI
jgi:hypothetical protein